MLAFLFPFLFEIVVGLIMGDSTIISHILSEFPVLIISGLVIVVPFLLISFLTWTDISRNEKTSHVIIKWIGRFIPVFALLAYMYSTVARAAYLNLPGASTSGISILCFPFLGVLLALSSHVILNAHYKDKKLKENKDEIL